MEGEREGGDGGRGIQTEAQEVHREETHKHYDVNVLSSWAKAQKGPLGQ